MKKIFFLLEVVTFITFSLHCADAQQPKSFRIGWIAAGSAGGTIALDAFRAGMRGLGYVEGRNLTIDARWGEGSTERLERLLAELVQSKPQAIVTQGPAAVLVRRAAGAIPVVFAFSGDPVEAGLVDSFARPGGNVTGLSFLALDLVGKRMELLKETIPTLKRVAILANPQHHGEQSELHASQAAAKALGVALEYFQRPPALDPSDALAAIAKTKNEAVVVFPDASLLSHSEMIAAFAIKNRIPAVSGWAEFAERGNLMTYGPNLSDGFGRLSYHVDKILKGAKPSALPVELPKKFELVINLNAAKQIGITVPPNVLARANRVIK